MKTGPKGIKLIKSFEGKRLTGYLCPAMIPTIGYGHTGIVNGKFVVPGMKITSKVADELLKQDLAKFEKLVEKYPKYKFTQNEFDAMVSFAYNLGSIDKLTANGTRSKEVIADKLLAYNKANGVALKGLTRRRKAERKLFLTKIK